MIPGTSITIQVERVIPYSEVLVTSAEEQTDTVLDSGATEHISPKVGKPLTKTPISTIHRFSGTGTPVIGMGTVNSVKNVMCCPGTNRHNEVTNMNTITNNTNKLFSQTIN